MESDLLIQWSHKLHQAASNGDSATLQNLLEQGHFPDTIGGFICWLRGASELNTRTPLHYSAKAGHLQCIRLLLKYGANPNARDSDGYAPIHYVCQIHNPSDETRETVSQCLESLMKFGGDTRARTISGKTPLDLARQHKNVACVNELIKQELQLQSLLVLSRYAVSALVHSHILQPVRNLWIPDSLKRYLLFEDVLIKWIGNK